MYSKFAELTSNQPVVLIFDFHQTITKNEDTKEELFKFPVASLLETAYPNLAPEIINYFIENIREYSALKDLYQYIWETGNYAGIASFASQDHAENNPNVLAGPNQIKTYLRILFEGDGEKLKRIPIYAKDTTPLCWSKKEHCQGIIDQLNSRDNNTLTLENSLLVEDNERIYVESMAQGVPTYLIDKNNPQQFSLILKSLKTYLTQNDGTQFSEHLISLCREVDSDTWLNTLTALVEKNEKPDALFYKIKIKTVLPGDLLDKFFNWLSESQIDIDPLIFSDFFTFIYKKAAPDLNTYFIRPLISIIRDLMYSEIRFPSLNKESREKLLQRIFFESESFELFNTLLSAVINFPSRNANKLLIDPNKIIPDFDRNELNYLLLQELVSYTPVQNKESKDIKLIYQLLHPLFSKENIQYIQRNIQQIIRHPLMVTFFYQNISSFPEIKECVLSQIYLKVPKFFTQERYQEAPKENPESLIHFNALFLNALLCRKDYKELSNFIKKLDDLSVIVNKWAEIYKTNFNKLLSFLLLSNDQELIHYYIYTTSSRVLIEDLIRNQDKIKSKNINWLFSKKYIDFESEMPEAVFKCIANYCSENLENLILIINKLPNHFKDYIKMNVKQIQNPYLIKVLIPFGLLKVNNALVFDIIDKFRIFQTSVNPTINFADETIYMIEDLYDKNSDSYAEEIINLNSFLITKTLLKKLKDNLSTLDRIESLNYKVFSQLTAHAGDEMQILENMNELSFFFGDPSNSMSLYQNYLEEYKDHLNNPMCDSNTLDKFFTVLKFFLQYLTNTPEETCLLLLDLLKAATVSVANIVNSGVEGVDFLKKIAKKLDIVLFLIIEHFSKQLSPALFGNYIQDYSSNLTKIKKYKVHLPSNYVIEPKFSDAMSITHKISLALGKGLYIKAFFFIDQDPQFNQVSEKEKINLLRLVVNTNTFYIVKVLLEKTKCPIDNLILIAAMMVEDSNIFCFLFKHWSQSFSNKMDVAFIKTCEGLFEQALLNLESNRQYSTVNNLAIIENILSSNRILWNEIYRELYPHAFAILSKNQFFLKTVGSAERQVQEKSLRNSADDLVTPPTKKIKSDPEKAKTFFFNTSTKGQTATPMEQTDDYSINTKSDIEGSKLA